MDIVLQTFAMTLSYEKNIKYILSLYYQDESSK